MRRSSTLVLMLATALGISGMAGAFGTPAGTTIINQAVAEALGDAPGAAPIRAVSDLVSTQVQAVCAVSVTPDGTVSQPGQHATVPSGGVATFAYRVVNTGNAGFPLRLDPRRDAAGTAILNAGDLQLYRDTNGNRQRDVGEPQITGLTLGSDEGADVLLVVTPPSTTKGLAYVALGASCASGAADRENVAELRVEGFSQVVFEKTFGAAGVAPGGEVPVTLRLRNTGTEAAADLTVTDLLNTPALTGLGFVAGSARTNLGSVEYSVDGRSWAGSEPQPTLGLRWHLDQLDEGAVAELTFALRAGTQATVGERANVATLQGASGDVQQARATVMVGAGPALALGPVNNPEATPGGELSVSDAQTQGGAALNQPVCFAHTVKNTGNLDDRVTLGTHVDVGEADVTLHNLNGTTLAQPVLLTVGASVSFEACYTPRSAAALQIRLTVTSSVGAVDNSTVDRLTGIDARTVALVKTVDPRGTVTRGSVLTYTLAVTNPYPFPLTNVVLRDALSPALAFVSADAGGTVANGTVTWTLASLAPGTSARVQVVVRVTAETADGTVVENRFSLTSDQTPAPQVSAPVLSPVWTAALVVEKTVSQVDVTPGDRLTYHVRVRNASPAAELRDLTVTDTLPDGLSYVPGSARMDDAALTDPSVTGRTLTWTLGSLAPTTQWVLSYDVRVLPGAGANLTNVVSARGMGGTGQVLSAVASNVAQAGVRVRPGMFASASAVIGRVFVDRNRDGVYQFGVDTPLERARVILAAGRTALTDAQGRYHFADVPGPTAALRLDPNSVPYPALSVPGDGGRPGSRHVRLTGLTSVDFPLQPLAGDIVATRTTTVRAPGFTLDKTVTRAEDGTYTVRLRLITTVDLPDFDLSDPLPEAAALLDGQRILQAALLPAGETTLTYRFRALHPAPDSVTDPAVRWRFQ